MASIGKSPTGSCVSMGILGIKIGISILATSVAQESLVLLLLDDSPFILDPLEEISTQNGPP